MKKQKKTTEAMRVSILSVIVNLLLSALKLAAGLIGHSQALVADAVHSASDVLSTLAVIAALLISGRAADRDHEYGHQKYESIGALLLALILAQVGIKIGMSGMTSIVTGSYKTAAVPTALTAAAALLSILVKEGMYRITIKAAEREKSSALKADAWHHRSDALSSVGSLAGVLFAMYGFPVMDPVAGLIIAVFILKAAWDIALDAVKALTDSACSPEIEDGIRAEAHAVPGVASVDLLKTRRFGSGCYADLEISVDGTDSLSEAHAIAEAVHDKIEADFTEVLHCMVHVNPAGKQ